LAIGVGCTGTKTFILYRKVGDRPQRITIGQFSDTSIEQARKMATQLNADIAAGVILPGKKSVPEITLGQLFDEYIQNYAVNRCSTWKDMTNNFSRYYADWAERKAADLRKTEVQAKVNFIGKNHGFHTANRSLDDVKAAFNWAINYGLVKGPDPFVGIAKFKTQARERFIAPSEMDRFFSVLRDETNVDLRDYVYLSLFTGARQANVLGMRWDQVDLDLELWRIPLTKNGDSQTLPLTLLAMAVLKQRNTYVKSEWVFPNRDSACGHIVEPKASWRKLLIKANLKGLRMHDLRRTLGSYMAMSNHSLHIIGKALGHKSAAATQIYSRLANDPVKRAMHDAQAKMLDLAGISLKDLKLG